MKRVRDRSEAEAMADPIIREFLTRRIDEALLDGGTWDSETYGQFLVAEIGDTPDSLEQAAGWPLFKGRNDDCRWGDPGYCPAWDWIADEGPLFELVVVLSDGGEFISAVIPNTPEIDRQLLAICTEYATQTPPEM